MDKQEIINFWKKLGICENNILEILEKATGLNNSQLFLSEQIDDKYIEKIEELLGRVVSGEPIEYIIEKAEFYGLDFYVDSRVLVPRNDTEVMVEQVLENIPENAILIDVWTWSSCIPISILKNLNKLDESRIIKTYAIDISHKVLEVSKINIQKHYLDNKIIQINSDLLEKNPLTPLSGGIESLSSPDKGNWGVSNIIITANLPYIKNWDFENMDEETVKFEPDLALYWWKKTGFELYEKLIFQIQKLFILPLQGGDVWKTDRGVVLFIEIWFDQKEVAKNFLQKNNLQFEIFKDNWGVERCVKIYF